MGTGCQECGTKTTDVSKSLCCEKIYGTNVEKYFPDRIKLIAKLRRHFTETGKILNYWELPETDDYFDVWMPLDKFFKENEGLTDEEMGVKWAQTEGMRSFQKYYENVCSGCVRKLMTTEEPFSWETMRQNAKIENRELFIRIPLTDYGIKSVTDWVKGEPQEVRCPGCDGLITWDAWEHD